MSFTDRHTSILIGTAPLITGASAPAVDEILNPSEDSWDVLTVIYAHRVATLTPEACAATYPRGAQLGTRKFWIANAKPVRKAAGLWFAEVTLKGWAIAKPHKYSIGAAAEQQSAENTTIFGVGTFDKVSIHQNTPTLRVSYLVEDFADANTGEVGQAKAPPITIDTPPEFWNSLADPVYHFPNGWVLMSSEPDILPGTTAALVSDTYKFIRAFTP